MKYYLLTFSEDYSDEHNVPALDCFTEKDYEAWLVKKLARVNVNYEQELKEFNEKIEALKKWDDAHSEATTKGKKYYLPRPPYVNKYHDKPIKSSSFIHAWLGNSGEGFGYSFNDCLTGKDFVDKKYVNVLEVDESFHKFFHKASLSELSLCNIFSADIIEYCDEDDSE